MREIEESFKAWVGFIRERIKCRELELELSDEFGKNVEIERLKRGGGEIAKSLFI